MKFIFFPLWILAINRVFEPTYDIHYKKHPGQLILNNGQVINGTFQYAYLEFPTWNFKYLSGSGNKTIKRYKASKIKSITLKGSDKSLFTNDSTYFYRIGKPPLYRQLTFGTIKIYDRLVNVNEKWGLVYFELYILENNKLKKIREKKFLKYIERYLKEKNIEKNFNNVSEAIHYLNYSGI